MWPGIFMMERVRDSLTQISQISRLLLFNSYIYDIRIRERESQLLYCHHFKLRTSDDFNSFLQHLNK